MANNFDSNFTRKLMKNVLDPFESSRVMSKNVNTQLFAGKFGGDTGDTIDVKRPTDYAVKRTSTGDISGGTRSDIVTGKASATVQDYITIDVDFNEADQALKMDGETEFWNSIANRMVTALEMDFASFMMKNTGLLTGTVGTGASKWSHIAQAGALMQSTGVPMNQKWCYALNPYSQVALADEQRGLGVNPEAGTANAQAIVKENFAGMRVLSATTLPSYSTSSVADRVGALSATPNATYITAKDTMTQVLALSGFGNNLEIKAGEQIQVTGRNRLNIATKNKVLDASGASVLWTATVTEDVTLSGTGTGSITVTGPAINSGDGAFNTVDSPLTSGDVVTLLGSASAVYQPNLFWHRDAFTIASVPLEKLYSTDTIATTKDGLQFRCSKYADGDANKQIIRFDFRPAYGVMNPFFAGQGYGSA